MEGLRSDELRVVPFSEEWEKEYEKEKLVLSIVFGDCADGIYHVGSTAIKGALAKPILDIAIDCKDLLSINGSGMEASGYKFVGEHGIPGRLLFIKKTPDGRVTHHVHCFEKNHQGLKDQLDFKNYLITHPEYIKLYNTQKLILMEKYSFDRMKYTEGKAGFIYNVLNLSRRLEYF